MTRRFEPGELVNVRLDGVRYIGCDEGQGHGIETPDGNQWSMPWSAVVERVAPKEWPPQIGDIWGDRDGDEWVAHGLPSGDVDFGPVGAVPRKVYDLPDNAAAHHGPMRLVRRRGWTPDRPPMDCCPDAPDAEVGGETVEDAEVAP